MTYAPTASAAAAAEYLSELFAASLSDTASLDTGWIDLGEFDKYQIEVLAPVSGLDLTYYSSSQAGGAGTTATTPTVTSLAFFLGNFICRQRYMRFELVNNTGVAQAPVSLSIKAFRGGSDKLSVGPAVGDPVPFTQTATVRAISAGEQPDGDLVNAPADGAAFESFTPLGASGVVESPWVDTDGFGSIDLFVSSDVPSTDSGIEIEFTRDAQAGSPAVDATWSRSFKQEDVDRGFLNIHIPPALDGARFRYTNGTDPQGSFVFVATLKVQPDNQAYNVGGAVLTGDFLTEVALGNVSNYRIGTKFGRNPDIDISTAPEDIWNGGGDYTGHTITTPETVDVASDSALDTAAGTGARTIRIVGLESDTATEYTTEDIAMNGLIAVTSTKAWWRINRAYVLTAGVQGTNQGLITVDPSSTGASARFVALPIGFNQTTIGAYTVPAERTFLLKRMRATIVRASGSQGSATMTLRVREPGGVYRSLRVFEVQTGGGVEFTQLGGDVLPPGTDIKVRVDDVSDNDTIAECAFEYLLLDR